MGSPAGGVVTITDPGAHAEPGRGFWIGLALGAPVMTYGAVSLVRQAGWPRAFAAGRWLAGGLLLHDLMLVPVVLAIVWVIGRATPRWLRTPLQSAVLGSALVLALAWPGLRGYGNRPDNPTVHPLRYGSALLTVLAVVWVLAAVWSCWRFVRRHPRPA